MSRSEKAKLRRQIDNVICSCWILPSRSNFGLPVCFVHMLDGTLHMGMDYHAVTATTVQDLYLLPPVEYLLNYVYSISWFTQLHCAVGYY